MSEASLEQNMAAARHEHVVPGREIHMRDMRGYPFCEVGLITGTTRDNAVANIWNTTAACEPTPQQSDALDAMSLAHENKALRAWVRPVMRWMFDRLDIREAGDDKIFGDITGTWIEVAGATLTADALQGSYEPTYIHRNNAFTFTFSEGSEIYVLDAPDGEMFVMQSCTDDWRATLGEGHLAQLYRQLNLPEAWGFRAVTCDQDIEVTPNSDNLAHMLQDELQNVYQGSDVGRAFGGIWPANPPGYAL